MKEHKYELLGFIPTPGEGSDLPATFLAVFFLAYLLSAFSRPATTKTISTLNTPLSNKHMLKKAGWRRKGTTMG